MLGFQFRVDPGLPHNITFMDFFPLSFFSMVFFFFFCTWCLKSDIVFVSNVIGVNYETGVFLTHGTKMQQRASTLLCLSCSWHSHVFRAGDHPGPHRLQWRAVFKFLIGWQDNMSLFWCQFIHSELASRSLFFPRVFQIVAACLRFEVTEWLS